MSLHLVTSYMLDSKELKIDFGRAELALAYQRINPEARIFAEEAKCVFIPHPKDMIYISNDPNGTFGVVIGFDPEVTAIKAKVKAWCDKMFIAKQRLSVEYEARIERKVTDDVVLKKLEIPVDSKGHTPSQPSANNSKTSTSASLTSSSSTEKEGKASHSNHSSPPGNNKAHGSNKSSKDHVAFAKNTKNEAPLLEKASSEDKVPTSSVYAATGSVNRSNSWEDL